MNLKNKTWSAWLKGLTGLAAWLWLVLVAAAQFTFTRIPLNHPDPLDTAAGFGEAVVNAGDVNGDGVPDILVGAPHQHVGSNSVQGRVFVFSGFDNTLLLTLDDPDPQAGGYFGLAVASGGDVNGDGLDDILVGAAPKTVDGNTYQGQAFVFNGATGSLLFTLNTPNPQLNARFGAALTSIGDVNGDGMSDILVGTPGQSVVFVYSGADASLLYTVGNQLFSGSGEAVANVGDIDDDGIADILLGAPSQDVAGNTDQGQAFLLSGANGDLLFVLDQPTPGPFPTWFGQAVAGAGDVNGDAIPDLLVGAPYQFVDGHISQGRAFVFSGSNGSLLLTLDNPHSQTDAWFGLSVAGAGDINGDGFADLLVGAYGQEVDGNESQGQVFVFSGDDGNLLLTMDTSPPQEGAFFGSAVAGAGDLNNDGLADLLIGAPGQDVNGRYDQGQVFVFVSNRPAETAIQLDIQPGSDPNIINLGHTQSIRVALLAADDFEVPMVVDENSLTFGRTGGEDSLLRNHGVPNCRSQDVNADGLPDLVCTFRTQRAGFVCGNTAGTLQGMTLDGIRIAGQGSVVIEPCRP